jgi:sarcosine oxidase subunit beta
MTSVDRAELVVVGAGTIGGWASTFAALDGIGRVIVVERGIAGQGASSRAAGIVRAQGGTPTTVALGRWSIDFYRGQPERFGTDSGFRELGYVILAVTEEDERAGRERVAMQRAAGLDVRWLSPAEAAAVDPTLATDGHRGGSYLETDGHIDPPRNVRAYSLAMQQAGVELRERTTFAGLRTESAADGGRRSACS